MKPFDLKPSEKYFETELFPTTYFQDGAFFSSVLTIFELQRLCRLSDFGFDSKSSVGSEIFHNLSGQMCFYLVPFVLLQNVCQLSRVHFSVEGLLFSLDHVVVAKRRLILNLTKMYRQESNYLQACEFNFFPHLFHFPQKRLRMSEAAGRSVQACPLVFYE